MNQRLSAACVIAFLAYGSAVMAAEAEPTQDATVPAKAVDPKKLKSVDAKTMKTPCHTNETNCAGRSFFQNADTSRSAACTVYFNNGASGQSNFVMPPKQIFVVHARTGDTYSCAWGETPPPSSAPRNYVWVR